MLTVCALSPVKSTRSIRLRLTRPRDRFSIMFIKVFIYSGVRRVLRAALQDASDTVRKLTQRCCDDADGDDGGDESVAW